MLAFFMASSSRRACSTDERTGGRQSVDARGARGGDFAPRRRKAPTFVCARIAGGACPICEGIHGEEDRFLAGASSRSGASESASSTRAFRSSSACSAMRRGPWRGRAHRDRYPRIRGTVARAGACGYPAVDLDSDRHRDETVVGTAAQFVIGALIGGSALGTDQSRIEFPAGAGAIAIYPDRRAGG